MSKISPFLFIILLMFGCEEKHFTQVYDNSVKGNIVKEVRLSVTDLKLRKDLMQLFRTEGIRVTDEAPYTLEVEAEKYPRHCNNPLTCSYDATYDGFMKIRLLRGMHALYMTQQDYHGVFHEEDVLKLVNRMYDDLDLKK